MILTSGSFCLASRRTRRSLYLALREILQSSHLPAARLTMIGKLTVEQALLSYAQSRLLNCSNHRYETGETLTIVNLVSFDSDSK